MPILDISALLKPVPGDDPGGVPPETVRDSKEGRDPTHLEKIRREAKEQKPDGVPSVDSLPVNDSVRVKYWRDAMKLAQDLFATKSKNLGWAVYAVDTAARSAGIAGLREGLQFLTRLTSDHWHWLWPRPNLANVAKAEEDDREYVRKEEEAAAIEARAGRFNSLDDANGGLYFPNVIRETVLAEQDGVIVSVFAARGADGKPAKLGADEVQSVARKLGPDRVKAILAEVDGTLAELEALRQAAEARFEEAGAGDMAPSFREVRLALEDCRKVVDDMYAAVETVDEPAAESEPGEAAAGGGDSGGPAVTVKGGKLDRAGLYKQVAQIADHLARIEPHSPVPYLLRRVVELQDLPFPQLVREFTRSSETVLAFLERSLPETNTGG